MKHWKAITGVVLVFGLGMFAGGFVTLAVVRHRLLTRGPQVFAGTSSCEFQHLSTSFFTLLIGQQCCH